MIKGQKMKEKASSGLIFDAMCMLSGTIETPEDIDDVIKILKCAKKLLIQERQEED
jgi:hypothetical protein